MERTWLVWAKREPNEKSRHYDWSRDGKVRKISVANCDVTGQAQFSIVKVSRDTYKECEDELDGQISDGIWEDDYVFKTLEITNWEEKIMATEKKKVWIINGTGDDGEWDVEIFDSYEKAKAAFEAYIKEFKSMFPDAEWEIEDKFAKYDNDNHYDTFWIEETEVK